MFRNPIIDVIVVLVIVLLIFGPKRLPSSGRGSVRACASSRTGSPADSKDDEDRAA